MKVDASDVEVLGREFKLAGVRVGAAVAKEMRAAGRRMKADARGRAPRATGALRDSINDTYIGDGRHGSMTVEVSADIRYAPYVEEGTSDTSPQPFLGPTFDAEVPLLARKLVDVATKALG